MASKKQIAELHTQLTLDIKQYVNELNRAGKVTKTGTNAIGRGMAGATRQVNALNRGQQAGSKSASRFGLIMQQSGYQVQDFVVQVGAGQNAMIAFAQQGSQMLGIFGPAGAVAGAALAIGAVVTQLIRARAAAADAKTALLDFDQELKKLSDIREQRFFSTAPLGEQKRGLLEKMETARKSLAESTAAAGRQLRLANMSDSGFFPDFLSMRRGAGQRETATQHQAAGFVAQSELKDLERRLEAVNEAIKSASAEDAQAREKEKARIQAMVEEIKKADTEVARARTAKVQELRREFDAYADEQNRESERIRNDAAKRIEAMNAEGLAIKNSLRTPTEQYNATLERLNELLEVGALNQETFQRAAEEANQTLQESTGKTVEKVSEVARVMDLMWNNVSDRAGQAFADMVLSGENAFDQLADIVARSMLEIAARMAIINPLLNFLPGVNMSGWWNFDPPAASGGDRRRPFLAGENGPELVQPAGEVRVLPAAQTAAMSGGGGTTVYIDAKGADSAAISRLWSALQQVGASVEPRSLGAMADRSSRSLAFG